MLICSLEYDFQRLAVIRTKTVLTFHRIKKLDVGLKILKFAYQKF